MGSSSPASAGDERPHSGLPNARPHGLEGNHVRLPLTLANHLFLEKHHNLHVLVDEILNFVVWLLLVKVVDINLYCDVDPHRPLPRWSPTCVISNSKSHGHARLWLRIHTHGCTVSKLYKHTGSMMISVTAAFSQSDPALTITQPPPSPPAPVCSL